MSTIASPREPQLRRIPSSSQTPTSSRRASVETIRSATGSPNPSNMLLSPTGAGTPTQPGANPASVRRNRAALREYYHLKKTAGVSPSRPAGGNNGTPVLEITEVDDDTQQHGYSEVPPSEIDRPGFDADAYVRKTLQTDGLEPLLRTYTRVLGEIRALDAEKKGLVYDNYSRLITATETIRKMRATMDPLNPMAATLDPAIAHIYTQAKALRDSVRASVPDPNSPAAQAARNRARTRQLAAVVLQTPDRLRELVREGRTDDAQKAWERPRQLLQAWKAQGVGGTEDIEACLADGEAALRGEGSPDGWRADTVE